MKNRIFSKPFLLTLFWQQNKYHKHGVLMHTLEVAYHALKYKDYRFFSVALLHDIGKPFVAYQKKKDVKTKEWSFTDHEELSYQLIKDWQFISEETKRLVRYHYLIRDIQKHKTKNPKRSQEKQKIWDSLDTSMHKDLKTFQKYDDLAK